MMDYDERAARRQAADHAYHAFAAQLASLYAVPLGVLWCGYCLLHGMPLLSLSGLVLAGLFLWLSIAVE